MPGVTDEQTGWKLFRYTVTQWCPMQVQADQCEWVSRGSPKRRTMGSSPTATTNLGVGLELVETQNLQKHMLGI